MTGPSELKIARLHFALAQYRLLGAAWAALDSGMPMDDEVIAALELGWVLAANDIAQVVRALTPITGEHRIDLAHEAMEWLEDNAEAYRIWCARNGLE